MAQTQQRDRQVAATAAGSAIANALLLRGVRAGGARCGLAV